MVYVEWLRVRRRLMWFAAIAIVLLAINLLPIVFGHVTSNGHGDFSVGVSNGGTQVGTGIEGLQHLAARWRAPLSYLLGTASLLTLIFTSSLGASLNAQREMLNLAFTKPVSRERLALTFFGVDFAAIVACYAFSFFVICLGPFAVLGLVGHIDVDPYVLPVLLAGIGVPIMYYGILQCATAWIRGGAGLALGLSWPVFLIAAIPGSPPFGSIFNAMLDVVRFFDPIVYLRNALYYVALPMDTTAAMFGPLLLTVWAIGLVGCACAIVEWRRLEV
jgi:hypothetical protein